MALDTPKVKEQNSFNNFFYFPDFMINIMIERIKLQLNYTENKAIIYMYISMYFNRSTS